MYGTGTIHFGEARFPVELTIDTTAEPHLELAHATRDRRRPGDEVVRYRVPLLWTVPTYGCRRWWFQCPRTRRTVTQLYLPNGGWYFWSRQAYRLGYACQREAPHDRLLRKAQKLHRALGGDGAVVPDAAVRRQVVTGIDGELPGPFGGGARRLPRWHPAGGAEAVPQLICWPSPPWRSTSSPPSLPVGAATNHNDAAILALNVLAGWSGLGWIAAFVWSLTAVQKPKGS